MQILDLIFFPKFSRFLSPLLKKKKTRLMNKLNNFMLENSSLKYE